MSVDTLQVMADLLLELETELRRIGLWSDETPDVDLLGSTVPFAADKLDLEQWLQWVFIPQIKRMIESDLALPGRCDIHPYAEERMKQITVPSITLLDVIRRIDRHISDA